MFAGRRRRDICAAADCSLQAAAAARVAEPTDVAGFQRFAAAVLIGHSRASLADGKLEQMTDEHVRKIVAATAERLVREEIERIKDQPE